MEQQQTQPNLDGLIEIIMDTCETNGEAASFISELAQYLNEQKFAPSLTHSAAMEDLKRDEPIVHAWLVRSGAEALYDKLHHMYVRGDGFELGFNLFANLAISELDDTDEPQRAIRTALREAMKRYGRGGTYDR